MTASIQILRTDAGPGVSPGLLSSSGQHRGLIGIHRHFTDEETEGGVGSCSPVPLESSRKVDLEDSPKLGVAAASFLSRGSLLGELPGLRGAALAFPRHDKILLRTKALKVLVPARSLGDRALQGGVCHFTHQLGSQQSCKSKFGKLDHILENR